MFEKLNLGLNMNVFYILESNDCLPIYINKKLLRRKDRTTKLQKPLLFNY